MITYLQLSRNPQQVLMLVKVPTVQSIPSFISQSSTQKMDQQKLMSSNLQWFSAFQTWN